MINTTWCITGHSVLKKYNSFVIVHLWWYVCFVHMSAGKWRICNHISSDFFICEFYLIIYEHKIYKNNKWLTSSPNIYIFFLQSFDPQYYCIENLMLWKPYFERKVLLTQSPCVHLVKHGVIWGDVIGEALLYLMSTDFWGFFLVCLLHCRGLGLPKQTIPSGDVSFIRSCRDGTTRWKMFVLIWSLSYLIQMCFPRVE